MTTLTEAVHEYFRGEKNLGVALAVYGVFLLGVAVWVWRTQDGAFATALLVPLAVLGLGFAGGGSFLAVKTGSQVEKLEADLKAGEKPALDVELARMAKVNANWPKAKLAWGVVTVVALVLLLAVKRDWASGLGLALLFMTTALMATDVFAERRAQPYTRALEAARGLHTP
ncbi:MAG: hypothetical protein JNK82_12915 [Myxococcaceae bacterium]|nr:hypothetical protein [Myxococcaceae bacterium]